MGTASGGAAAAAQVLPQGGVVAAPGGGALLGWSGQPMGLGLPPTGPRPSQSLQHRRGSVNSNSNSNRRGSSGRYRNSNGDNRNNNNNSGWTQVGSNGRPVRNNYGGPGGNGRGSGNMAPPFRSGRVVGSGGATNTSFRGAPLPRRDLFVSRVDPGAEESEIRNHILSLGITDFELNLISNGTAPFKSFKLIVNVRDKDTVMSPDVWPEGVCIKRYRERVNRDNYLNF